MVQSIGGDQFGVRTRREHVSNSGRRATAVECTGALAACCLGSVPRLKAVQASSCQSVLDWWPIDAMGEEPDGRPTDRHVYHHEHPALVRPQRAHPGTRRRRSPLHCWARLAPKSPVQLNKRGNSAARCPAAQATPRHLIRFRRKGHDRFGRSVLVLS